MGSAELEKSRAKSTADVILFGVLGMSPGVVTETVWALAHEEPPVIPHEIIVLTTSAGREQILRDLFEGRGAASSAWQRLRAALHGCGLDIGDRLRFGPIPHHIRVFPTPDGSGELRDISVSEESRLAADVIMRELRSLTEQPDTTVVASIAGGRKTMSALLTSCMMLLGRTRDRLCHVLVNAPFDQRLDPPFLFPEKRKRHRDAGGRAHSSAAVRIDLIDIPFVRTRGWYEREYRAAPPNYMTLVKRMQGIAPRAAVYPLVRVDTMTASLHIGRVEVTLSSLEFALLCILLRRHVAGHPLISWHDIEPALIRLDQVGNVPFAVAWRHDLVDKRIDANEDPRKVASRIRAKLRRAGISASVANALIPSPRARGRESYPKARIRMAGNADVI